jgi:hypothetical protein
MTKANRTTIPMETTLDAAPAGLQAEPTAPLDAADAPSAEPATSATDAPPAAPKLRKSREGTKQAKVIALLRRDTGATLAELTDATGWQIHTVRGVLAGTLKRLGMTVISDKTDVGERVYRLPKEQPLL